MKTFRFTAGNAEIEPVRTYELTLRDTVLSLDALDADGDTVNLERVFLTDASAPVMSDALSAVAERLTRYMESGAYPATYDLFDAVQNANY